MAIPSKQIGWGTESNLLWQILKQLNKLTSVLFGLKEAATPKYKVFTALVTQSGGTAYGDRVYGDILTLGVTYLIYQNIFNEDLTIFGAPNSNVGTYFICTTVGVLPDGTGLSFDNGAPVAIVLENTIGNVWFTYVTIGDYKISSEKLFIINKTNVTSNLTNYNNDINISKTSIVDDYNISLRVYGDGGGVQPYNNFTNVFVEIRVYN